MSQQEEPFAGVARAVLAENAAVLARVDGGAAAEVIARIVAAPRIYLLGEGRSGLIGQAFAMRLMHLGCQTSVVGGPTTPAIQAGDLLIALSASGETAVTCLLAETAAKTGAAIVAITAEPASRLGRLAELVLTVPAKKGGAESIQFGGSLFEQSALLVCDALVVLLMRATGKAAADLARRHTNLE